MRASTDAASSLLPVEVDAGALLRGAVVVVEATGAEGDEPPMAAMRASTDAASSFWLEALGADAADATGEVVVAGAGFDAVGAEAAAEAH